ncbi:dTDP-4-dehydrorhamnose 3,5-epimerase [Pusillimonas sp. T2]|nr:dTDP-4-dehydrorhamnose 3,5-epimerase [Pusillimonas sp. T2]
MKIMPTALHGVFVVDTQPFNDHRGAFTRLFCGRELASILGGRHIVQINHSRTTAVGAVRGMHYQSAPHAEMKLVRCLKGRVWDVAVDLRAGSPSFMRWHAQELSPDNACMLVIPEGCAHGFQALEPDSELLYLHTALYAPDFERGVAHDEPQLAIEWPLSVVDLSVRDQQHPRLPIDFPGLHL